MKKNINKYRSVTVLPKGAMTVKAFADSKGFSTQYVYKMIKAVKPVIEVIEFQTMNFVILKNKQDANSI